MTTLDNGTARDIAECALRFIAANKRAIDASAAIYVATTDAQISAADIAFNAIEAECDAELLRMTELCSPILAARGEL